MKIYRVQIDQFKRVWCFIIAAENIEEVINCIKEYTNSTNNDYELTLDIVQDFERDLYSCPTDVKIICNTKDFNKSTIVDVLYYES